jgi:hypothetical protein
MEPVLGRHELNSLKDKCIFSFTISSLRIKTEMHITLSLALGFRLSNCKLKVYTHKSPLPGFISTSACLGIIHALVSPSEMKTEGLCLPYHMRITLFSNQTKLGGCVEQEHGLPQGVISTDISQ